MDIYFSADVEADGPIPGPYSMLSFGIVYAGRFDRGRFERPDDYRTSFYRELRPISDAFVPEALAVSGLDRDALIARGDDPAVAMSAASEWVRGVAGSARPILVAYPLGFDWMWLYWYFVRYSQSGSPFAHSSGFDIKTAVAAKARIPIAQASRDRIEELDPSLRSDRPHTHNALDDAIEQAEIFANVVEWDSRSAPGGK